VQFGGIKNTSASSGGTGIGICCLATLKLFYQIVDFFLCITFELDELFISFVKKTFMNTSLLIIEPCINLFVNIIILGNNILQVNLRDLNIYIFPCILIHKILQI
jgi:hypothetical protein